jgi:23S rRNA (adenine2030-N6)-methyltransferase
MLSYRHSYHAGNFADVVKHLVLAETLAHLVKKDKPFDFVDTHAGAGLFDLHFGHAEKLKEYRDGIGKLWDGNYPELADYFGAIRACNRPGCLDYYPGSPLIARHFMRAQDRAWLFELHPADVKRLEKNVRENRRMRVACQDGHQGLLAVVPPASRRGLILIDPSYEVKSEYEQVVETIGKAYLKFSTGIFALWYPVVEREKVRELESRFVAKGIRDIQQFELAIKTDSDDRGMTGAGMIVINPPWGLAEKMSRVLPDLVHAMGVDDGAGYLCETLVPE